MIVDFILMEFMIVDFNLMESVIGYGHTRICFPTASARSEGGVIAGGLHYCRYAFPAGT